MSTPRDPFSEVYRAVANAIFGHSKVAALVKPGNRVRLDDDTINPIKDEAMDADFPEVAIIPGEWSCNPWATSTSSVFTQTYLIRVATGTLDVHVLNPLKWAICCAIAQVKDLRLPYVSRVMVGQTEPDTRDNLDPNRGTDGWSSVAAIQVELRFDRQYLEAQK